MKYVIVLNEPAQERLNLFAGISAKGDLRWLNFLDEAVWVDSPAEAHEFVSRFSELADKPYWLIGIDPNPRTLAEPRKFS